MKGKGRYQVWLTLGIFCVFVILPCAGYGASLTIGNTVSVNGNLNATSFSGDGSGLTNVGGNSSCTSITSLPITITAAGVYCLTSNLVTNVTSGNAIEIATDDVVINLNGYTIDGLAAGPSTAGHSESMPISGRTSPSETERCVVFYSGYGFRMLHHSPRPKAISSKISGPI